MPDISKINNVAVADISKLDSITFAHGQKVNNQSVSLITDSHTLIATATASSSATLAFTSGIDSTYDAYEFRFTNIHPASDNVDFSFQVNATDGADYNDSAITSTHFAAYHHETNTVTNLHYDTDVDQAQGTAYQVLARYFGNVSDESGGGVLTLYAPSSTTYVKHFTSRVGVLTQNQYFHDRHVAGYINDTTAIDNISFKFSSGNIDAGVIKMYGIAKA